MWTWLEAPSAARAILKEIPGFFSIYFIYNCPQIMKNPTMGDDLQKRTQSAPLNDMMGFGGRSELLEKVILKPPSETECATFVPPSRNPPLNYI